jgi:hypothetical protein
LGNIPVSYINTYKLKHTELQFYLLFIMGVKHGLSHKGENKFMECDNRMLKRIYGPKREAGTGGWREL